MLCNGIQRTLSVNIHLAQLLSSTPRASARPSCRQVAYTIGSARLTRKPHEMQKLKHTTAAVVVPERSRSKFKATKRLAQTSAAPQYSMDGEPIQLPYCNAASPADEGAECHSNNAEVKSREFTTRLLEAACHRISAAPPEAKSHAFEESLENSGPMVSKNSRSERQAA